MDMCVIKRVINMKKGYLGIAVLLGLMLCLNTADAKMTKAAHQYYQGTLGQSQNAAHRLDGERQLFYAVVEGGQRAQEPAGC